MAARTAVLVVACTQCSRSGRYRVATLIDQHGAGCVIPELRRVLVSDCPKLGQAHGGCDVWFPELPALFRGDDEGNGGMSLRLASRTRPARHLIDRNRDGFRQKCSRGLGVNLENLPQPAMYGATT